MFIVERKLEEEPSFQICGIFKDYSEAKRYSNIESKSGRIVKVSPCTAVFIAENGNHKWKFE